MAPVLFQVGDYEVIRDESVKLHAKLKKLLVA